MTDLTNINIEKSLELLKTKKISSKELVEFYLKEAESKKSLNAYISLNFKNAINLAKESDKRISLNKMRPLEGIPIAIKDLLPFKEILSNYLQNDEDSDDDYDDFEEYNLNDENEDINLVSNGPEDFIDEENMTKTKDDEEVLSKVDEEINDVDDVVDGLD